MIYLSKKFLFQHKILKLFANILWKSTMTNLKNGKLITILKNQDNYLN